MEDIFEGRAQTSFVNLFEQFTLNLSKLWPDCEETKDLKIYYSSVIKGNDKEEKSLIDQWFQNVNTRLSKKVKYCKAVERIIQELPTVYHACEYNDIDSLEKSSEAPILSKVDLFTKYKSDVMSNDDKKVFWKYIKALNEHSFKYFDKRLPYVPTRDQIQKNIKEQKSQKTHTDETPSMNKAFQTSFTELYKTCKVNDISINDEKMNDIMNRWACFSKDSIDGTKVTTLCNKKYGCVLAKLEEYVPEIKIDNVSDDLWELINQLNGYATVGQNIPTKMMGKIENLATRLADDIVSGKADLASMNLNEIGREVLSQCDENDMSTFAQNIDTLLPALQHFQKQM